MCWQIYNRKKVSSFYKSELIFKFFEKINKIPIDKTKIMGY